MSRTPPPRRPRLLSPIAALLQTRQLVAATRLWEPGSSAWRYRLQSSERESKWRRNPRSGCSSWRTARRPRPACWPRWSGRRKSGPCEFALLIPDVTDRKKADWTLENAVPMLRRAAGGPVEGIVGGADPFTSVQDAVRDGNFDEIIISTLSKKTSKWLRRDLVRKVEGLGAARDCRSASPDDRGGRDGVGRVPRRDDRRWLRLGALDRRPRRGPAAEFARLSGAPFA